MNDYRVTITYNYDIVAESEETAKEMAAEMWNENVPESFSDFGLNVRCDNHRKN